MGYDAGGVKVSPSSGDMFRVTTPVVPASVLFSFVRRVNSGDYVLRVMAAGGAWAKGDTIQVSPSECRAVIR